jgi:hypothetical protein
MTGIERPFDVLKFKSHKEDVMPVHRQKKDTTTNTAGSTQEQTAPLLSEQQEFHRHLRALAQSAVRVVLEEVMREELDQFIGVAWREGSPKGIVNLFISPDEFSPLRGFFGLFHCDSSRKKAEKASLFPTFTKK